MELSVCLITKKLKIRIIIIIFLKLIHHFRFGFSSYCEASEAGAELEQEQSGAEL